MRADSMRRGVAELVDHPPTEKETQEDLHGFARLPAGCTSGILVVAETVVTNVAGIGEVVARETLDEIGAWYRTIGYRTFATVHAGSVEGPCDLLFLVIDDEALLVGRIDPGTGFDAVIRDRNVVEASIAVARSDARTTLRTMGFSCSTHPGAPNSWTRDLGGGHWQTIRAYCLRWGDEAPVVSWEAGRWFGQTAVSVVALSFREAVQVVDRIPFPTQGEVLVVDGVSRLDALILERASVASEALN